MLVKIIKLRKDFDRILNIYAARRPTNNFIVTAKKNDPIVINDIVQVELEIVSNLANSKL